MFVAFINKTERSKKSLSIVKLMTQHKLDTIMPTFFQAVHILSVIPATSSLAERSFSCLRRLKTYLRNSMKQNRL